MGTAWEIGESVYRQPRFGGLRLDRPQQFVHGVRRALRAET